MFSKVQVSPQFEELSPPRKSVLRSCVCLSVLALIYTSGLVIKAACRHPASMRAETNAAHWGRVACDALPAAERIALALDAEVKEAPLGRPRFRDEGEDCFNGTRAIAPRISTTLAVVVWISGKLLFSSIHCGN